MTLSGKVALITGAARGLGKGFAEALLKSGAKVCLVDILHKAGEETASEFQQAYGQDKAMFLRCDVTSQADMEGAFTNVLQRYGKLDIMVNNAGIADEHKPARMIEINVAAVIRGTNLAIDVMNKEKGGHGGVIINIASTAGLTSKMFPMPSYTASKRAVVAFTQCWSYNPYLEKMGLRFACLCPAFTATEMLDSPNNTLYPNLKSDIFKTTGINQVSEVVKGFMQLVEDEQCNGAILSITANHGIQYHKKPLPLSKM